MKEQEIKQVVREGYGKIARERNRCCPSVDPCCGETSRLDQASLQIGYSEEDLQAVPEGANLGLGCGNPVALASLREGEIVLDLGSGAGFDCFLAADRVGPEGRVIGVDMTPEMIQRARENATKGGYENVEFRLGEIEHLPVADQSVDVVLSNCVINLVPDKPQVFREAFRVLKPGGRLMISDLVLLKALPDFLKESTRAYLGCVAGAALREDYLRMIEEAGFHKVKVVEETAISADWILQDPLIQQIQKELNIPSEQVEEAVRSVRSIKVHGVKP